MLERFVGAEFIDVEEDPEVTLATTYALKQILSRASQAILDRDVWSLLLRVSFVFKHSGRGLMASIAEAPINDVKDSSQISGWSNIWEEALLGSGAGTAREGILRVASHVMRDVAQLLRALNWLRRLKGVETLRELSDALSTQVMRPLVFPVLCALFENLRGPWWTGRDSVVESIGEILKKCCDALDRNINSDILLYVPTADTSIDISLYPSFNLKDDKVIVLALADIIGQADDDSEKLITTYDTCTSDASSTSVQKRRAFVSKGLSESSDWAVSARAVLKLLFRELCIGKQSKKGDSIIKDNVASVVPGRKISAAVSLASLPWEMFTAESPDIFISYLEVLLEESGVSSMTEPTKIHNAGVTSASTGVTSTSALPSAVAASVQKPVKSVTSKPKASSSQFLFGSRYGQIPSPPKKITRRERPPPNEALVPTASTPCTTTATSNSSTENTPAAVTRPSGEPTIRVKLLECLARGWPLPIPTVSAVEEPVKRSSRALTLAEHDTLMSAGRNLLRWTVAALKVEVWSVKRALLLACGCAGKWALHVEDVASVLDAVILGLNDLKYAQVRMAAITCLYEHLQGSSYDAFIANEATRSRLNDIVKIANSDLQSIVLEANVKLTRFLEEKNFVFIR